MKKLLIILICLSFVNCTKKEWSRKKMVEDCIQEGQQSNKKEELFTEKQIRQICDCAADKTMSKYKSYEDALKDTTGFRKIGKDCYGHIIGE